MAALITCSIRRSRLRYLCDLLFKTHGFVCNYQVNVSRQNGHITMDLQSFMNMPWRQAPGRTLTLELWKECRYSCPQFKDKKEVGMHSSFLMFLWNFFNRIPESPLKMRLRFFMAFNKMVPEKIRRMSPVLASAYKHTPQPGDTVVEGGGFPGDFTIYASKKVGAAGHVYVFEPNPINFSHLKRHVEAFKCTNVTLIPKGLWSHDCEKKMTGRGVESHLQGDGTIDVKLASIDSEMSRLGVTKVDFIKMDIEGAEPEALQGAVKILGTNAAKLAIASYHDFEGHETRTGIEKMLTPLGYKFVVDFPERENIYAWKE